MKKSNLVFKSLMIVGALFMVSCSNDDGIKCPDPLVGELSAPENEFAGSWVFSGMTTDKEIDITDDNTSNPSTDIFAQYSECDRDLAYEFSNNRNYSLDQGYAASDCNNKLTINGTWSLTGNNLAFVANCSTQSIKIEFNETGDEFSYESVLNYRDISGTVIAAKTTFTYEKVGTTESPE